MNVNIIKVPHFWGPRHQRLLRIWEQMQEKLGFKLHLFENTLLERHDKNLNTMWLLEGKRPERWSIFTEIDFLPGEGFTRPGVAPLLAAQYCTRDFDNMKLRPKDCAGAWYVMVDKLKIHCVDFTAPGHGTDPANAIPAKLISAEDCWPEHYGVQVGDRGEHLFFSRFYDGSNYCPVPGLDVEDVLRRIDKRLDQYEKQWQL